MTRRKRIYGRRRKKSPLEQGNFNWGGEKKEETTSSTSKPVGEVNDEKVNDVSTKPNESRPRAKNTWTNPKQESFSKKNSDYWKKQSDKKQASYDNGTRVKGSLADKFLNFVVPSNNTDLLLTLAGGVGGDLLKKSKSIYKGFKTAKQVKTVAAPITTK